MESHCSISANIRQQGELLGQRLNGGGRYLEVRQGACPLVRLEMTIQTGEQVTTLMEVCDGQTQWTHRKLPSGESLTRIDVAKVEAAQERAAEAAVKSGKVTMLPGLGGLSRLLRGLHAAFLFDRAERGMVGDQPMWKLEGGWRPDYLVKLLPDQKTAIEKGRPADLSKLPQYAPDRVVLLLRQQDLFPARIDFCRTAVRREGQDEPPEVRSLMNLEFTDVNFSVPIDPGQFLFTPGTRETTTGTHEPIDKTEDFVRSLGVGK